MNRKRKARKTEERGGGEERSSGRGSLREDGRNPGRTDRKDVVSR